MRHRALTLAFAGVGLLLAIVPLAGTGAAAACGASTVSQLYDYADDTQNFSSAKEEAGHGEYDIIEVQSCVAGTDMVLGLRVAGNIDKDNAEADYMFVVRGPGILGENVYFRNHTASFTDFSLGDDIYLNNTTAGPWLSVWLPLGAYGNATGGWWVEARAGVDTDNNGFLDFLDWAQLDTSDEYGDEEDLALEPTPFTIPAAAITSLRVSLDNGSLRAVAEGTTTGSVVELRVAMGTYIEAGAFSFWSYTPSYWREETLEGGDPEVVLEKVGGSWSQWRFSRIYPPGSVASSSTAKLEVRALALDGRWGHANQSFDAKTATPAASVDGAPGGGSSTTLLLAAAAAGVAGIAAAAVVLVRRAKRAAGAGVSSVGGRPVAPVDRQVPAQPQATVPPQIPLAAAPRPVAAPPPPPTRAAPAPQPAPALTYEVVYDAPPGTAPCPRCNSPVNFGAAYCLQCGLDLVW